MPAAKPPNFLFIQADQMTAFALKQYGNPVVKTPNIDRLAQRGVVFRNAYCNNPICASSRFSMLAGQLPSKIGAYDNAAEFPATVPTFAHYLRDLGYHTCLSGKMHFVGPDQLHGFEERVTTDIYPSDFGWTPDWLAEGHQLPPSGMSMRSVVEAGVCKRSLQIDYDEEVCQRGEAKIWEYARAGKIPRQPFFLAVSFTHPHNPFTTQPAFWNLYRDAEINPPTVPLLPPEQRDPWSRRHYYLIRNDEHTVTDADVRNARHAYYGMCAYIDSLVGRLLAALADGGLAEDTVVVFTSDHGEMLGERGMWYKFNPYEGSIRVPLLVSAPGLPDCRQGAGESALVSLVDLLPTFLDLATSGYPQPPIDPLDGRSLRPLLRGDANGWVNEVMVEFTAEGTFAPALILRRGPCKYVFCETDPGMLFDLEQDPHELNNLCEEAVHDELAAQMRAEILARWDPSALKRQVIASQRRRHFLQRVLLTGRVTPWDYQPRQDASQQYLRSGGSPTQVKGLARFPFVAPKPPDTPRTDGGGSA